MNANLRQIKKQHNIGVNTKLAFGLAVLTLIFILAQFFNYYCFRIHKVQDSDMQRTLLAGDYVLINQLSYQKGISWLPQWLSQGLGAGESLAHGDLVAVYTNSRIGSNDIELKVFRIIAVPGDQVRIKNKEIYRNNILLKEAYTSHTAPESLLPLRDELEEILVPEDKYFVLSDNRDVAKDSRSMGYIAPENIIGKVVAVLFSYNDSIQQWRSERFCLALE